MNRMEEYSKLRRSLKEVPPQLEFVRTRVEARSKKKKYFSWVWKGPVLTAVALIMVFTVLTNTSVVFARAVSEIPILRELALFVAFDPSLKAAVENKYVQPVGLTQQSGGITVEIPYVIADQQRLSVYYRVAGGENWMYEPEPNPLRDEKGQELTSMTSSKTIYPDEVKGLQELRFDLAECTLPQKVRVQFSLLASEREQLAGEAPLRVPQDGVVESEGRGEQPAQVAYGEFDFLIQIDSQLTLPTKVIPLQREFTVQGQAVHLNQLEIYPTQAKLLLEIPQSNTALVKKLRVWLEDEAGNRWNGKTNGISGRGDNNGNVGEVWIESAYFTRANQLTLHIDAAGILKKQEEMVTVDLNKGTASPLPEHIKLERIARQGGRATLYFSIQRETEDHSTQQFDMIYYDSSGREYSMGSQGTSVLDEQDDQLHFTVECPEDGIIQLRRIDSSFTLLEQPVKIPIDFP